MPTADVPPITSPLTNELQSISKRFSNASTRLLNRINAFEKWLNDLPGKVAVRYFCPKNLGSLKPVKCGLSFARDGKTWAIQFARLADGETEKEANWKSLTECDLDSRIIAAGMFEELLKKMIEQQQLRAKKLEEACDRFDSLANSIGLTGKEGE